uniref:ATP-dependent Clp protease proteolytic subunit n=1 Tax=Stichococcus bacillaris TaxID=37433 RepID=A0A097KKC9_9CHLO|nr:proteolytic subunit 2 of clp protease [Stichococcus bacillaris]AIT93646.1 proteolytic subunit 2 of clp protease [Stichococcus bacillaris]
MPIGIPYVLHFFPDLSEEKIIEKQKKLEKEKIKNLFKFDKDYVEYLKAQEFFENEAAIEKAEAEKKQQEARALAEGFEKVKFLYVGEIDERLLFLMKPDVIPDEILRPWDNSNFLTRSYDPMQDYYRKKERERLEQRQEEQRRQQEQQQEARKTGPGEGQDGSAETEVDPDKKEKDKEKKAEIETDYMEIFDSLARRRTLFLGRAIDNEVANNLVGMLLILNADPIFKYEDVVFYLNSPGGEVHQGIMLADAVMNMKSSVITVGFGEVSSIATLILTCGSFGKRFAYPNCRIMLHQPETEIRGSTTEIVKETAHLLEMRATIGRILYQKTGRNVKKIAEDLDRDTYLSAEEAVDYGLVDQVTNVVEVFMVDIGEKFMDEVLEPRPPVPLEERTSIMDLGYDLKTSINTKQHYTNQQRDTLYER